MSSATTIAFVPQARPGVGLTRCATRRVRRTRRAPAGGRIRLL